MYKDSKVIIYGVGIILQEDLGFLEQYVDIIGYSDKREVELENYVKRDDLKTVPYDYLYISTLKYFHEIKEELIETYDVDEKKIICAKDLCKELEQENKIEEMVIVRNDGGICSQMNFYVLATHFMENGYPVKFDNQWFSLCGRDIDGIFIRNFDLLNMFPDLTYMAASPNEIFYYKHCFQYVNDTQNNTGIWREKTPPVYLDGYYVPVQFNPFEYKKLCQKYFHKNYNVLNEENAEMFKDIVGRNSVGIHVRLGDLKRPVAPYGDMVSNQYFLEAIKKLKEIDSNLYFYFFSEEPDWIRGNLIPVLEKEIDGFYQIVDINGADKGYMDLLLMTGCNYIISSKGSAGKFAALLTPERIRGIVLSSDENYLAWWKEVLDDVIIVNE